MAKFMCPNIWSSINDQTINILLYGLATGWFSGNIKILRKASCSWIEEELRVDMVKSVKDANFSFVGIEEINVFSDASKLHITTEYLETLVVI